MQRVVDVAQLDGAGCDPLGALLELQGGTVVVRAVDGETRRGRDHVRITLAMTIASADVAGALAEAWQTFRDAARDEDQDVILIRVVLTNFRDWPRGTPPRSPVPSQFRQRAQEHKN